MQVLGYTKNNEAIRFIENGDECVVPVNAIGNRHLIMIEEWVEAGNTIPPYVAPEPTETIKIVYPVELWRRMTQEEVTAVESFMSTQPTRLQRIFNAATEYRSDDELWETLDQMATGLFGKQRADIILAPSIEVPQ